MKYAYILSLLALSFSFTYLHEYYVSITTVQLHKNGEVDLTFKFTAHDIEEAIEQQTGVSINVDEQSEVIDSLLSSYIKSHFQVKEIEELSYLGKEFNLDETLYVYFTSKYDTAITEFDVNNSLLIQTFEGQENVTHINKGTIQKSVSFKNNLTHYTININE